MVERALDGVKVVEYSSFVAGPYCAKLLADLGAEVIKIERPGTGDEARARGPFLHDTPHPDLSGLFLYLNSNKLGVTLNLDSATGRSIFRRLMVSADVLIEDCPPGKLKDLGLGYDTFAEMNPRLVMMSITPFGQTGPYRNYKSYYLNTYHAGGAGYLLPSSSPDLDREPIKGPGFLGEYDGGLCAAVAILGALYWRGVSGLGQHIDVSKQEALMALEKMELSRFHAEGKNPTRGPGVRPPMKFMRSKNGGLILLEAPRDNQWKGLVELMGNPEWAKDEKYETEQGRREHGEELRAHLDEWAQNYTTDELFHGVQGKQCPAAPVNSVGELLSSPQIQAREFLTEIEHPVAGRLAYPATPYHFSKTPTGMERPAPLVGQHNEEIFCHRLGYTREELVKFKEAGVI